MSGVWRIPVVLGLLLQLWTVSIHGDVFPLSIIHINDFHARFEPTNPYGGTCDPGQPCIGGYARTVHTVRRLLEEQKHQNPIYLNAGDSFQGTLWYNVGRWNVTSQFLNILPADAMTLGNHEFDHSVEGVVPFLETIDTNMLVANMDTTYEPTMTGKYNKSVILERGNRKIGVIGVILETTDEIASSRHVIFTNESAAIREEAAKLRDQGANIILVITHCGYDVDQLIAKHAGADIDVIIGSHSHTFLFTGDKQPGPDTPRGPYPTEVIHESGHRVLIVQAAAYAKYVGNITVFFDDDGHVVDYEGAPIYMDENVPEDAEVLAAMGPWKEAIDGTGNRIVGETLVNLEKAPCSYTECNLGNFYADAMIQAFVNLKSYHEDAWTSVAIGLINNGALRVPLMRGNISYSHLVTMSPFENVLTAFNLSGADLLKSLEFSVHEVDLDNDITSSMPFLQVSGLKIIYNFANPVNHRVVDVRVRCADCLVPRYEALDPAKIYRIVAPIFLVEGGDGFAIIRENATDLEKQMTDLEALLAYTQRMSPIYTGLDRRITVITRSPRNRGVV